MKPESRELINYLKEIAKRSLSGEISWIQPNPSSFIWNQSSDNDSYVVTIQKASNPKYIKNIFSSELSNDARNVYMFQVQSKANRQTVVSLSSGDRPEFSEILSEIFESAERGVDVRSSKVLEKLLSK